MKYRLNAAALSLILGGCATTIPSKGPVNEKAGVGLVPPAPQESRLTREQEGEISGITAALSGHLNPKYEKASEIVFDSATKVRVYFSDGGMHGGGIIYLEKLKGEWVFKTKWGFL